MEPQSTDALVQLCQFYQIRNTYLRLEQVALEAELREARSQADQWKQLAIQWEVQARNWQQVALAAIAKADQCEVKLMQQLYKTPPS